ncbi:cbb3-type cytochrome c oxidase subunit I [Ferdinandcohnia quinoae]|uniref:Cbb3-type cytochrome c oxidase subunit I n=1 Tax=Fredinandcohnia quinoae TaxID=2918902 RepID=A0AAW5DYY6_9BACI|nr:cbb3-type cytochrome c oxidase subunit I [Fredinandcohnia sp. SECRCQ15]MCH1625860.1 cbb3-type cytochrome c oxidase subunit I [Fredinandcohnia sp. SECRCQ15]
MSNTNSQGGNAASQSKIINLYLLIGSVVILLMMVFGVLMLLAQGKLIDVDPGFFYEILTVHGTGMVGASALAASAIMWYFLSKYVQLNKGILIANFIFFIVGVVLVLVGIFAFDFAGAWTFLYPLPAISGGGWGLTGAALYLIGMLLIGIGFLLLYLETARGIIKQYGSLGGGLGWSIVFGRKKGYGPPAAVVASTMVSIVNITALVAGASVIVMSLINLFIPSIKIDPLLAKNLTYAFGHIFANSVIYMGVIAVYEILAMYTKRPWKANRPFLIAWNLSTIFTIIIYPHHLLMDFALPKWMIIMGQALSYANGLPVLVVTAYGALMIVYRSGIKWDIGSSFIFLSMFGWVIGVVPAIVDATIVINHVMHNTKWVPGHFHMYMGLGATAMLFGFMYYLAKVNGKEKAGNVDYISFWVYVMFFLGLCGSFLFSGKVSAPRRWAEHFPEWIAFDRIGAVFGTFVILAVLTFVIRFIGFTKSFDGKIDHKFEERIDPSSHA